MLENLTIFWLLPSLIVFFIILQSQKRELGKTIEEFITDDWINIIIPSIIYPIGFVGIICYIIWPWLIKERKLFWNYENSEDSLPY